MSAGAAGEFRSGEIEVNNDFWMPLPEGEPAGFIHFGPPRLTPAERTVLRRLRRGAPQHGRGGVRERTARRRRRRTLDRLAPEDLRSLVRIVMELGL